MDNRFLSLIYPSTEKKESALISGTAPRISEDVCEELGLSSMLSLKNGRVSEYFTSDEEVIRYRQKTLSDLIEIPELGEALGAAIPVLCDILELRRLSEDMRDASDTYLYSITEIELYISAVDLLCERLSAIREMIKSPAFKSFSDYIFELSESEDYRSLSESVKKLSAKVREVRSITVGVNLDAQMRPVSAGVISVNSEKFKSGRLLDKVLRMSFKNDALTCIAELTPFGDGESENRREALVGAFNRAIEDVFRHSVRDWRRICSDYVLDNTDFLLKILPEIEFVSKCASLISELTAKGYDCVVPTVCDKDEKAFSARALYNPDVALRIDESVVDNDFEFDSEGKIFVLSGPNRGGKSVITCAVGLCQAMMQLGMPVPASEARLSVVDGIFTHFPEGAEDTIDKGRLGEECARLGEIFDSVTEYSMILLDESLSSTGAYEASYIAAEILTGFAGVGCRGIFSTHLHELAAHIDEINERSEKDGGVKIDTLVAGIEEGRRSFKIVRKKPDGKSYAKDIANKYGLSYEDIKKRIKR